jgi:hypothetical protein
MGPTNVFFVDVCNCHPSSDSNFSSYNLASVAVIKGMLTHIISRARTIEPYQITIITRARPSNELKAGFREYSSDG